MSVTAAVNGNDSANGGHNVHQLHMQGLSKKVIPVENHSSLPADYYYSETIYRLERRAIFSRRWFLVSHLARYRNVGDYVQYEMAGYNFVVVKNKLGKLVGFHNICRHRAFPIVHETFANAKIFSCKYHGWSYDLSGNLTKAPRFSKESVPAFDASNVRLFPIHIHVDRNDFVYVNLDAGEEPEISWEGQYGDLDQQPVLKNSGIDWKQVEYEFTWTKTGNFNWKVMQDNYNECYHCLSVHPDVAKTTALDTYYVMPGNGSDACYISHYSEPKAEVLAISRFDTTRFAGRSATHVFPAGQFSPNPGTGFMHLMRSIPLGPNQTRQEYDVYKLNTPNATPEAHERMTRFYKKVVDEDFVLCEGVQRNLEREVWERGPLHPFHEEGVWAFQGMVLDALKEQVEMENKTGAEIWAAKPQLSSTSAGKANLREHISACELMRSKGMEW